jgi:hypothetical protein
MVTIDILINIEEINKAISALWIFAFHFSIIVLMPLLLFRIGNAIYEQTKFLKE